ncbi:hypothetical protein GCM10023196_088550 [Actinoallomurus vinaceus]|uniref:Chitin-binding type-2 domain-containing protein n=1 Tax=Actinoallomurus vinaceus TaxID=1080074 RepID=A0ABP8UQD1_9ACTN
MHRTVITLTLLGSLSVAGCSTDSQPTAQPATPPIASPTQAAAVAQGSPTPSPQQSRRAVRPTHPTARRAPRPTHTAAPTCGAPPNPDRLNFCGRGSKVYNPPADVRSYFECIPNFSNGRGYMVQCNDGAYSMSGGRPGTCSHHSGEGKPVLQG